MESGLRTWKSEASTIDTTYLIAGALTAAQYFDRHTTEERGGLLVPAVGLRPGDEPRPPGDESTDWCENQRDAEREEKRRGQLRHGTSV